MAESFFDSNSLIILMGGESQGGLSWPEIGGGLSKREIPKDVSWNFVTMMLGVLLGSQLRIRV